MPVFDFMKDAKAADTGRKLTEIPVASIHRSPYQPRVTFDEESIAELAQSIRQVGLIQPLVVRKAPEGGYELVAGERRLRAVGRQKARILAVKIAVFRARCISFQLLDGNARQRRLCRVCHPKGVFIRLLGQKAAAADGGIRFQRSSGCALAHRSRRAWQVARRLRGLTVRPLRRKASRLPLSSGRFRRTFALRRRSLLRHLRRLPVRRLRLHGCAFFGQRSALRHSRRA